MKLSSPFVILTVVASSFAHAQAPNPLNLPDPAGIAQHNDGHRDDGHAPIQHRRRWHNHHRHQIHPRRTD